MYHKADNDQLLNEIRKVVRDEVKAEGEAIRKDMATKNDLETIKKAQQEQGEQLDTLLKVAAHTDTALKIVDDKINETKTELEKIKQRQRPQKAD